MHLVKARQQCVRWEKPMIEIDAKLIAYADGELDRNDVREVEALIASDPRAWQTVLAHWQTAAALRAACHERFYVKGIGG